MAAYLWLGRDMSKYARIFDNRQRSDYVSYNA